MITIQLRNSSLSGFSFESWIISLYFTAALAHSALTARSVWESLSTQSSWSATLEVIRGETICKIKGLNIKKPRRCLSWRTTISCMCNMAVPRINRRNKNFFSVGVVKGETLQPMLSMLFALIFGPPPPKKNNRTRKLHNSVHEIFLLHAICI